MTPTADSELSVRFHDMSLDPYLRPFVPRLSPFATAVVSGSLRVSGRLADVDHLLVDGTVDTLDMRLFDYALKNAEPIRLSLDQRKVKIGNLRLVAMQVKNGQWVPLSWEGKHPSDILKRYQ